MKIQNNEIDPIKNIQINEINPAKYNPRKINNDSRRALKNSMDRFKDISGIIYNKKTKTLIGGHHRWDELKEKYGTNLKVNHLKDEFFSIDDSVTNNFTGYLMRVVDWDKSEEKVANITANSHTIAGEWDLEVLPTLMEEIYEYDSSLKDDLNLGRLELDLGIKFTEWDSDIDAMDKITAENSDKEKVLKIKSPVDIFDQVAVSLKEWVKVNFSNKGVSVE